MVLTDSYAVWLASQPASTRTAWLATLTDEDKATLAYEWRFWARPSQLPPPGTWRGWLILTGRGWGKTRTAAEWVRGLAERGEARRIALVNDTAADVRDVMVEGPSGLLAIAPPSRRPLYEPSKRRVTWPNGAMATCYAAEAPDLLRGPEHDTAWCLVPGTPVRMADGIDRPIEAVRVGDQVQTPVGPRPVLAVGSRVAPLVRLDLADGRSLIGSADHPIATSYGWCPLGTVQPARDRVLAWVNESTGDANPEATTWPEWTAPGGIGIGGGGWSSMGRSRPARSSTIATASAGMIGWPTWNWSPPAPTAPDIRTRPSVCSVAIAMPPTTAASTRVGAWPGAARARVDGLRRVVRAWRSRVGGAASPSSSWPTSTVGRLVGIAVSGVSTSGDAGVVHNLTIGGAPVFIANGILTHNCDEPAKWKNLRKRDLHGGTAWDNLLFGLRIGANPRWVATTTPRGSVWVGPLLRDPTVVVTRGHTTENAVNLAGQFMDRMAETYAGTRLGRQELGGEVLEDVPGALWSRLWFDRPGFRLDADAPPCRRVVVAVDPAITATVTSNETGIIVAGRTETGAGVVLADRTIKGSPDAWARRAVGAYREFKADAIVAEANQGGDMVRSTLRTVDPYVPVTLVHATRGKRTRAEPVAALYEQGRVHHVGLFDLLEDQLVTWDPEMGMPSPDRLDALVWALTDLIAGQGSGGTMIRVHGL